MYTKVLFEEDSRESIKKGIDVAAKAVGLTIGPRGRNVSYDKGYGGPEISNDGKDILDQIKLKDPNEQKGVEIAKYAAEKTNEEAGDGTTTTTDILWSITTEGMRYLKKGANVVGLKEGIKKAADLVIERLDEIARPVSSQADLLNIATISSESTEMGKVISDIIGEIGPDGSVDVQESPIIGYQKEIVQGMEIDKGFSSHHMVTDLDTMTAVAEKAIVILTDKKITSPREMLPIIEQFLRMGKKELLQFFVIAEDFSEEFLSFCIANKFRGGPFRVIAVKTPGFGDRKKEYLEDIAVITGTKVISDQTGFDISMITPEFVGRAEKIIAYKERTKIIDGGGKKEAVDEYLLRLKSQRDAARSEYEKKKLEERIAKVSGGISILRVGAATEGEISYIKPKIEDAINATKAAREQGIVPGGGTALVKVAEMVRNEDHDFATYEDLIAMEIVLKAIEHPFKQILKNAGLSDRWKLFNRGSEVQQIMRMVDAYDDNWGYDALAKEMVPDMYERGIVDPVKVTKAAVKNAASSAATFLTIDCAISQIKEPSDESNE